MPHRSPLRTGLREPAVRPTSHHSRGHRRGTISAAHNRPHLPAASRYGLWNEPRTWTVARPICQMPWAFHAAPVFGLSTAMHWDRGLSRKEHAKKKSPGPVCVCPRARRGAPWCGPASAAAPPALPAPRLRVPPVPMPVQPCGPSLRCGGRQMHDSPSKGGGAGGRAVGGELLAWTGVRR